MMLPPSYHQPRKGQDASVGLLESQAPLVSSIPPQGEDWGQRVQEAYALAVQKTKVAQTVSQTCPWQGTVLPELQARGHSP